MGLYSSFYASLSGLSTNASNLSVIGNNLANLNTIGYKGSSGTFQDLFSASLGSQGTQGNGNPIQIGLGTRLGGMTQNFGQGSFQSTSNVTDLAISGQGLFALTTQTGTRAYTRAGNFTIDKTGSLVDTNGSHVLGWNSTGGAIPTSTAPVPVALNLNQTSTPFSTTRLSNSVNFNPGAANATSFTTPMQVYDSLGTTHTLLFNYTKRAVTAADPVGATSAWDLTVTTDDLGPPAITAAAGFTSLTFNSNGALLGPAANPTLTLSGPWSNGGTNGPIAWDIWNSGVANLTGFSAPSAQSNTYQNGYGSGTIQSIAVDQTGLISGTFSNGQTISLAQVALASFSNMNGLSKQGNNSWAETLASGSGSLGVAGTGGRGTVLGGNLELSNVDVAEEFTKLIVAQRGYQANGKVVTTADELLQETLNLKR